VINPWEWLQGWCRADERRHARFEVDRVTGQAHVTLTFRIGAAERQAVTASGSTFDVAVLDARRMLPAEVRQ
jgi:hypothetical protein